MSPQFFAARPTSHLQLDDISLYYGDRRVLANIDLTVTAGERIGLIGENGSGKSSLLKIAAGILSPDKGTARYDATGDTPVGLLHQKPPFSPEATVTQALESAVRRFRQSIEEVDQLASLIALNPEDSTMAEQYATALGKAEQLDAWNINTRVDSTLAGLCLSDLPRERKCHELSGGEQARLSLAWLLLHEPDILLLDEPTNHLDDAAVRYLEGMLASWRGPVMFASHDRTFLDATATGVADLDQSPVPNSVLEAREDMYRGAVGITRFTGTYSDYLAARAATKKRWEQQYRDEQLELSRLRTAVENNQHVGHSDWKPRTESKIARKFYGDRNAAVVSRRVNDSRTRLENLEANQIAAPPRMLTFGGLVTATNRPSANSSLAANEQNLYVSALELRGRLDPVSFTLNPTDKLLVTGANGAGKSTLLKLLIDQLSPTSGAISKPPEASIELLTQETQLASFPSGATALEAYIFAVGLDRADQHLLDDLGLLAKTDQNKPIDTLSLGQLKRLELAIVLARTPDILLLDEPTNHLALSLVSEIEEQIPHYPGIVIVTSHDRWLRTRWKGKRLHLGI